MEGEGGAADEAGVGAEGGGEDLEAGEEVGREALGEVLFRGSKRTGPALATPPPMM